jgi:uridine kinase
VSNTITVQFQDDSSKEVQYSTTCLELAKEKQNEFKHDIIAAKINNALVELNEKISKPCTIEFFDLSSAEGNAVYVRGLQYLFIKAVKDIIGYDTEVKIEHSIDKGIYCEISADINNDIVSKITARMEQLVQNDIPFEKLTVNRREAIEYFKKANRLDKAGTLNFAIHTNVTLYKLDNIYDYFFGEMPPSTGSLKKFALTYVEPRGIVLRFPTIYDSDIIPEYIQHQKLFDVFREYSDWGKIVGINSAVDLNEKVMDGSAPDLIRIAEVNQNNKLYNIVEEIYSKRDSVKLVLIAGPSSSGKTTMSHKLSLYLKSKGLNPTPIGLDNYYMNRIETPKDSDGNYDYESIDAIDIKLFNDHLTKLLNGEEIIMPEYNFITGEKEFKNKKFKLNKNDILIIEGLHGLNEKLTLSVPRQNKYKIYISPLTVLNIDNHNRISTSLIRKLRRTVRDYKFRGYSAEDTMRMWNKVRQGEEKYVFPFQDEADVVFNTALIYELGVLKIYLQPLLFAIKEDSIYYDEARQIIKFLDNFLAIPPDAIPNDSLIREFIGGSCFKI